MEKLKLQWQQFIGSLIDSLNYDKQYTEKLKKIFKLPPVLTINNYKHFVTLEAEELWEQIRTQKRNLYTKLYQRIYDDLMNHNVEYVVENYNSDLKEIASVLGIDYKDIISKIIDLYYYKNNEHFRVEIEKELKEKYERFVRLSRSNLINQHVNVMLNEIKTKFVKVSSESEELMDKKTFLEILKKHSDICDNLIDYIKTKFNFSEFDRDTLLKLISSIIDKDENEVFKILNIKKPEEYDLFDKMKALKRLRQNYSRQLRIMSVESENIVEEYLNSYDKKEELRANFSEKQLALFNDIIALMKESQSTIDFNYNKLFKSKYREFNSGDKKELLEFSIIQGNLKVFAKRVFSIYRLETKSTNEIKKEILNTKNEPLFNDNNYKLDNTNPMFNAELLVSIIKGLDRNKVLNIPEYAYQDLNALLYDKGFLSVLLYGKVSGINICDLINNFSEIHKGLSNRNDSSFVLKRMKLYTYATHEQIQVLGLDVVEKIVNNNQFLSDKLSPADIKERIEKAIDLYERSEAITKSSIPYDCDVTYGNIKLSRYLNNDPQIFVSGIDTNSCFRLSSNDNDFLYYTILSKNGFVLKLEDEKGNLVCKIIGIRRNNILELNSIRDKYNNNIITSKEVYEQYNSILGAVDLFAKKMLEITSTSETPIDFIVVNKAGILEVPEFNNRYEILSGHLFSNPIDMYNDDWYNFVHTYDGCEKNYLQQATEKVGFTTDFGCYPVVMIASRNNKLLSRLFDISYSDPIAEYERPDVKKKVK